MQRLYVLQKRLEELQVELSFDETAVSAIAKAGYDPVYGARPLRRYLQSSVETLLARAILSGEAKDSLPGAFLPCETSTSFSQCSMS